jgi:RNA polymerase sigma factor (sigma-70 family)
MVKSRSRLTRAFSRTRLRLATDEQLVAAIRRRDGGSGTAFEALYERHAGRLLSFCVYMLGSRDDAEDAVQAAFASAHRALLADGRDVVVRPWLFTIARNECLDILRKRRPTVELNGEVATSGDPVRDLELHEDLRNIVEDVRQLPERQRVSLVLAEVDGLSQAEIASVLDVRSDQVKAYMYQARANLISERSAREADCQEIRHELATARGAVLLRGRIRRHVRSCVGCQAYADALKRQHHQLTAFLPIAPTLGLKYRVLEEVLGTGAYDPATYVGGAGAGAALTATIAELAGGSMKAVASKIAVGVLALGATAEVGVTVLRAPARSSSPTSTTSAHSAQPSSASGGKTGSLLVAKNGASTRTRSRPGTRAIALPSTGAQGEPALSPGNRGAGEGPSPSRGDGGSDGHGLQAPQGAPDDGSAGVGTSTASAGANATSPAQTAKQEESARHRLESEQQRAARKREREEHKAERASPPSQGEKPSEEPPPEVGFSEAPKKTPQERAERREEREHKRAEREEREREEPETEKAPAE